MEKTETDISRLRECFELAESTQGAIPSGYKEQTSELESQLAQFTSESTRIPELEKELATEEGALRPLNAFSASDSFRDLRIFKLATEEGE